MLFVPLAYQPIKGALLAIIFMPIAIRFLYTGRLSLHPEVLLWTLFAVSVSIGSICLGLINNNPGALRVATVYVLWPLLFTIILSRASDERILCNLIRVLAVSLFVIALYTISYILSIYGWVPEFLYIPLDQHQDFNFRDGYTEYYLHNINSLFFLIPFFIAALLTWPRNIMAQFHRLLIWISLVLGLGISIISGRRALILVITAAPIITLLFQSFLPHDFGKISRRQTMRILCVIIALIIGVVIFLQYAENISAMSAIESVFSGGDYGDSKRIEQFNHLLAAWADSPVIGAGLGASVPGYIRSEETPWSYELTYMALLFQTGLLGFFAYAAAVAWIFWRGLIILRSADEMGLYMLPLLVGLSCFLIANASNPYLMTFDYMWVIFLPITFINFWMLKRKKKTDLV